jgi:hypothetical protein
VISYLKNKSFVLPIPLDVPSTYSTWCKAPSRNLSSSVNPVSIPFFSFLKYSSAFLKLSLFSFS